MHKITDSPSRTGVRDRLWPDNFYVEYEYALLGWVMAITKKRRALSGHPGPWASL